MTARPTSFDLTKQPTPTPVPQLARGEYSTEKIANAAKMAEKDDEGNVFAIPALWRESNWLADSLPEPDDSFFALDAKGMWRQVSITCI